jgi:hypothetical protein
MVIFNLRMLLYVCMYVWFSSHDIYKSIQGLADFTGKYASLLCRWKFANIFCDLNGVQCGKNVHIC